MKRLIFVILCIIVYVISLQWQAKRSELLNQAEHPSIFSEWKKHGIPVYTAKIIENDLSTYLTVTGLKKHSNRLIAEVPPQTAMKLSVGLKVVTKTKHGFINGVVTYVSKDTTRLSGLTKVIIKFSNKLPNNKYITADIAIMTLRNKKIIPYEGISLREAKPFVFKIDKKGKLIKQKVTIIAQNNKQYAVGNGLIVGDIVVVSDLRSLSSGDKVLVVSNGGKL